MEQMITARVHRIDVTEELGDTLAGAIVGVDSRMNLSEEFAITTAQYALSTEIGCDLDAVTALGVEATYMGDVDQQWLVTFEGE